MRLQPQQRWIYQLHICGAKGATLLIQGVKICNIDSNEYVVDFNAMIIKVHSIMCKLRDIHPRTIGNNSQNDQLAALREYDRLYKELGQVGVFMIVVNNLKHEIDPEFPTEPRETKWFYFDAKKANNFALTWPGLEPSNVSYRFIYAIPIHDE